MPGIKSASKIIILIGSLSGIILVCSNLIAVTAAKAVTTAAPTHVPVTQAVMSKTAQRTQANQSMLAQPADPAIQQADIASMPLAAANTSQSPIRKTKPGRLSLNFQDIKVRSVLQLIGEFTGLNIVVSDSVQGSITLRLNDVPWEQALNIVLQSQGLTKRQTGNVLIIAPITEMMARDKAVLDAQQQMADLAPLQAALIPVKYGKATDIATLLKTQSNTLLSTRGNVSADTRTNTIWVQDTAAKLKEIRQLVHDLDIPAKQVLIEARIVNVNSDFERDLGIRFGITEPDHLSGTLAGANQIASGTAPSAVAPINDRLNVDLPYATTLTGRSSIGLALAKLGSNVLLDLELSALESEGGGKVISSPRLITANQQPATIQEGKEIPYQQSTSSGATSIEFKKAVLMLKVTPQITPDDKIIMDLLVTQDKVSTNPNQTTGSVPAIDTQQIETQVEVNNGETLVLGGIYEQDKKNSITRVPFLGSLPGVGVLFRNSQVINDKKELLIFVTPKIIQTTEVANS